MRIRSRLTSLSGGASFVVVVAHGGALYRGVCGFDPDLGPTRRGSPNLDVAGLDLGLPSVSVMVYLPPALVAQWRHLLSFLILESGRAYLVKPLPELGPEVRIERFTAMGFGTRCG